MFRRRRKPKTHAWLVAEDGRSYQLSADLTTLGRSAGNDIRIRGDASVSRQHAKIKELEGHFTYYDLGTTTGSRVNGKLVRAPVQLQSDDLIQLGDGTTFRFVASER